MLFLPPGKIVFTLTIHLPGDESPSLRQIREACLHRKKLLRQLGTTL